MFDGRELFLLTSRNEVASVELSESVVLALAGGLLGVWLAQAAIGLLRTIAPAQLPRVDDIAIGRALRYGWHPSLVR